MGHLSLQREKCLLLGVSVKVILRYCFTFTDVKQHHRKLCSRGILGDPVADSPVEGSETGESGANKSLQQLTSALSFVLVNFSPV